MSSTTCARGRESETLNVLYVTDAEERLITDLRIREVLLAPLHAHVREIAEKSCVALSVADDKQTAVALFKKYDRVALPVVDPRGRLVGIVTVDDVLDVAEESATKAIQRFGGMQALDQPYLDTPFWALMKKRTTWLVLLFLGGMRTVTLMGTYEDQISRAVVLALFVPLIIASGGNSGS